MPSLAILVLLDIKVVDIKRISLVVYGDGHRASMVAVTSCS